MAAAKKILVVEDERDISELVIHYLTREGYRASAIADGRTALLQIQSAPPDLVILDLMLPGMDGLEICRRLRQDRRTAQVLIIMLTAKGEESDKIVGLEMGADDYVTKPFSPKELMARVKSLLRRSDRSVEREAIHRYKSVVLDRQKFEVTDDGREIILTAKEFGLLEALMESEGRVLTREYLLNNVWGYDYYGSTRTVDVHIRHLREKIPLLTEAIMTVKNIGYKLRESA